MWIYFLLYYKGLFGFVLLILTQLFGCSWVLFAALFQTSGHSEEPIVLLCNQETGGVGDMLAEYLKNKFKAFVTQNFVHL